MLPNDPCAKMQKFQLTRHLFQDANSTNFGMDLMALNLQRGRDHGIPPYVEYRKLCGLPDIRDWRQLSKIVAAPEVIKVVLYPWMKTLEVPPAKRSIQFQCIWFWERCDEQTDAPSG